MAEINWGQLAKDAEDVVIADGEYACIVSKSEAVTASTGKPMLKLQLTIIEGPKRDRKVFTQIVLSADNPFALQRWFAHLAAFGLDKSFFDANPTASVDFIAQQLMNRGVVATVGHREWQGRNMNEVQSYKPYAPSGPVPPGVVVGRVTGASTPATPTAGPVPPSSPASATPGTSAPTPPSRPF
jgi:hypothetical protein